MVDKTRQVSFFGGIYNQIVIDAKHVVIVTLLRVQFLAQIAILFLDVFADILHHHFLRRDLFQSKHAPRMDRRFAKLDVFLAEMQRVHFEDGLRMRLFHRRFQSAFVESQVPRVVDFISKIGHRFTQNVIVC